MLQVCMVSRRWLDVVLRGEEGAVVTCGSESLTVFTCLALVQLCVVPGGKKWCFSSPLRRGLWVHSCQRRATPRGRARMNSNFAHVPSAALTDSAVFVAVALWDLVTSKFRFSSELVSVCKEFA